MFVLARSCRFPVEATVIQPSATVAGTYEHHTFGVTLELVPEEEVEVLTTITAEDFAEGAALAPRHADKRFLRRMVQGWSDVTTPDGTPVPFTPEALEQAINNQLFRLAVFAAYRKAVTGGEALRGN